MHQRRPARRDHHRQEAGHCCVAEDSNNQGIDVVTAYGDVVQIGYRVGFLVPGSLACTTGRPVVEHPDARHEVAQRVRGQQGVVQFADLLRRLVWAVWQRVHHTPPPRFVRPRGTRPPVPERLVDGRRGRVADISGIDPTLHLPTGFSCHDVDLERHGVELDDALGHESLSQVQRRRAFRYAMSATTIHAARYRSHTSNPSMRASRSTSA